MSDSIIWRSVFKTGVFFILLFMVACQKKEGLVEDAKVKPPVRAYVVTARIDKKGTNSNSEGTAVLKGNYDEGTKVLNYSVEFKNIDPVLITLRSGAKGSVGSLITEIYKKTTGKVASSVIKGGLTLTSLQERNLLKGRWFVAVNTVVMSPEISGMVTLKQQ